jgi:hypothetical protein
MLKRNFILGQAIKITGMGYVVDTTVNLDVNASFVLVLHARC